MNPSPTPEPALNLDVSSFVEDGRTMTPASMPLESEVVAPEAVCRRTPHACSERSREMQSNPFPVEP